ncbi:MAG: hypothetical protein WCT52_00890 [Candidatus Micrarchaeia archaeon]|jgi:hypothetical protein
MSDPIAVFVFYLGIAEVILSGCLFWVACDALRKAQGKSFYRTMRTLCVAVLLFFTVQVVSKFRLMREDMLVISEVLSSIMLVLLLISVVSELTKGMMAHEHLMKHRRHGRRDVD